MTEKWHNIYKELSEDLLEFYRLNTSECSKILFRRCFADKALLEYNEWIFNISTRLASNGIDPVHVFSSFNRSKQRQLDRVKIINLWFKILKSKRKVDDIDFTGCPTPFSIKLLSVRDSKSQQEIWRTFSDIKKEGQNGITEMVFSNVKLWYGIDVSSFTIFLFWIDPKNFLSLDKNSEKLLLEAGIIKSSPRTSYQYVGLLPQTNTTLYQDIARLGYQLSSGKISKDEVKSFVQKIRYIYNKFNSKLHTGGDFTFKIVAIKPLARSYKKHTKVLSIGTLYSFYNEYKFQKDGTINVNRDLGMDLYNANGLAISVSAIVGKNGSGKSTISELLYLAINNLAAQLSKQNILELTHEPGVNLEIYFTTGTFCRLRLIGKKISITEYELKNNILHPTNNRNINHLEFSELFYTIAINYSHYGLNSLELGDWISKLFHKNDGYQTPLVINPFRHEGNFNINVENELVKSRLLANIVQPIDDKDPNNLRVITDNKRSVTKVIFFEHSRKIEKLKRHYNKNHDKIFETFLKYFNLDSKGVPTRHLEFSKLYIGLKIQKICKSYPPYYQFLNQRKTYVDLRKLDNIFSKINSDSSHIVYKVKQIINFFRYKTYRWYPLNKNVDIKKISKLIEGIKSKESRTKQIRSIELLPPSFYDFELILNDNSNFQKLSSGEKQRIHTVSSIIYHLYNLDSVSEDSSLATYQFVNITFDEVELYFHPEMQRKFIDYFLEYLKRVPLDNIIALNVCFITHSPFILSDIPSQNILFLNEDGKPNVELNESTTLGGNIHDLLSNNFFLNNGYMGDYANKLISSLIAFLTKKESEQIEVQAPIDWSKEISEKFIRSIGEPLIRHSLEDMFLIKYKAPDIDKEIERLQRLKARAK